MFFDYYFDDFDNLSNDLFNRFNFNLVFDVLFVIFDNGSLSLAGFASWLGCFGLGLGHGSDNKPLFGQTLNPCQVVRPERV